MDREITHTSSNSSAEHESASQSFSFENHPALTSASLFDWLRASAQIFHDREMPPLKKIALQRVRLELQAKQDAMASLQREIDLLQDVESTLTSKANNEELREKLVTLPADPSAALVVQETTSEESDLPFRELLLRYINSRPNGAKFGEIRDYIQRVRPDTTSMTVASTLYRFSSRRGGPLRKKGAPRNYVYYGNGRN